ncbi:MAG: hypothetical protein FI703_07500 [SAR202 cluster bacterium]|nr:hypothetical protein [SAR202 cluster bacterium]
MSMSNGSDEEALEFTLKYNPPMDLVAAEKALKEAKRILDQLGVVFLLSSGTCMGAIRDNAFIPWDDDIDLISVIGINGFTYESVDTAIATFRENGYFVYESNGTKSRSFSMIKDHVRTGWDCYHIIDENVWVYPRTQIPAKLFTQPKEIEFLNEKFLVPNPPEEYLRRKYGEEWRTPKRPGEYEKDVVSQMPSAELGGEPARVKILDEQGNPVAGAEVVLAGGGSSETDDSGYADVILAGADWYALVIRYPEHEKVLYMEDLEPGKTYVYRADFEATVARNVPGQTGTLGNVLTRE